uniref:Uncharacterized protein n=1 Tax=Arundo donax TaxID=35708 RepID=A0A0A8YKS7_ARUDO
MACTTLRTHSPIWWMVRILDHWIINGALYLCVIKTKQWEMLSRCAFGPSQPRHGLYFVPAPARPDVRVRPARPTLPSCRAGLQPCPTSWAVGWPKKHSPKSQFLT